MDAEKEIEDMATSIALFIVGDMADNEDILGAMPLAKGLYNLGYRNYGEYAADCLAGTASGLDIIKALAQKRQLVRTEAISEFVKKINEYSATMWGSVPFMQGIKEMKAVIKKLAAQYGVEEQV